MMEESSMTALAEKLTDIGGTGPLKAREWRIRCRLNWHDKASSAVRHLIYGERRPSLDEAREIEAAHLKYCAEKILENRAENASLLSSMHAALAAMESSDPEFYRAHIEALGAMLLQSRSQSRENGGDN
jgi:hypothetical protein